MVHTLCYYDCKQHPPAEYWRQRERSMDCTVPSNVIIPAVAARLKYYLDVERKEAGFDLSIKEKDSNGKQRLYQFAEQDQRSRRRKENFWDNKLEASLRSYTGKSGRNKKVEINLDHRQQVQRRIRENMSSFTIPERFTTNYVFLRGINWKDRLQNMILAIFTNRKSLNVDMKFVTFCDPKLRGGHTSGATPKGETPLKSGGRQSLNSVCVNIPTACEEPSPNTKTSCLDEDGQIVKGLTCEPFTGNVSYRAEHRNVPEHSYAHYQNMESKIHECF
ncbi:uncharacterized protein LOC142246675 [Anomaloglossus baeobatrachus]|uniref:uncharacterized protein LOC142246675 n=1 Tax=Anomaloglossus baeobatrachus TaxID=238106 RepID=UPI003F504ED8